MATRFAAEGMAVVLADIEEAALDAAASTVGGAGHDVLAVPTDVSQAASVDALADAAFSRFGAVHVVCNNAGVTGASGDPEWEKPLADWDWVLGVNLYGVIHGVRAFVPRLVEQGTGHVVNTASVAGLVALPFMGPYTVSKHAVVGLSECLYHELAMAGSDVGVSVLCPGFVKTRLGDSTRARPERYGGPIDVAPGESFILDIARGLVDAGTPAADVADEVVDAIRSRRFWILTHEEFDEPVRSRFDGAVAGTAPRSPLG
jgi:NAD(P)-dependent dehydrogenase (short-subunit alcohol dehydrogenase family)